LSIHIYKKEYKELFKEEVKQPAPKKRVGKVISITKKGIAVDVAGNGERIAFDPQKHSKLTVGDKIEI